MRSHTNHPPSINRRYAMSITARRSRRAAVAGLAICTALAASTFAANAGAAIAPVVLPPPPVGAVLKKLWNKVTGARPDQPPTA